MMKFSIKLSHITVIFGLAGAMSFIGCMSSDNPNLQVKPKAYSKLNELTVIADTALWNGPVGDTFRFYFEAPFLILPQPEPMFDLRHFSPRQIAEERLFRSYRNYIILANLEDANSMLTKWVRQDLGDEKIEETLQTQKGSTSVGKDKWASDQTLYYIFAPNAESLAETAKMAYPAIRDKIHQKDASRVQATVFQGGSNGDLSARITERFGAIMKIPKDYKVAIDDGEVMWLRKETKELSGNLLLTRIPYTDADQLTMEGMKQIRNQLGKKYISSNAKNSYMIVNDVDLPMFIEKTTINNRYAVKVHGIWELVNDFMGGPFISVGVVNEEKGEIFFVDGFIFAPGEKKRNSMQYMEAILNTIEF